MTGIAFDGNAIFNGMVGTIAIGVSVWAARWAGTRLGLLNDRLSLRVYRAELAKVEALVKGPSHVTIFLLANVLICFAILGAGLAYAPIAFMGGGAKWAGAFLTVMSLAIYTCAIYTLGILYRLKKGETYLIKQREKVAVLERKLKQKPASPSDVN